MSYLLEIAPVLMAASFSLPFVALLVSNTMMWRWEVEHDDARGRGAVDALRRRPRQPRGEPPQPGMSPC
jgi:hypothetical protein